MAEQEGGAVRLTPAELEYLEDWAEENAKTGNQSYSVRRVPALGVNWLSVTLDAGTSRSDTFHHGLGQAATFMEAFETAKAAFRHYPKEELNRKAVT